MENIHKNNKNKRRVSFAPVARVKEFDKTLNNEDFNFNFDSSFCDDSYSIDLNEFQQESYEENQENNQNNQNKRDSIAHFFTKLQKQQQNEKDEDSDEICLFNSNSDYTGFFINI